MRKYDLDILALQETMQPGNEILNVGKYKLFKIGCTNRYCRVEIEEIYIDFKGTSDRIGHMRIRSRYWKISILNGHAHTEQNDSETKNEFYQKMRETRGTMPRYDIKIVAGILNGKVVKVKCYRNITRGNWKGKRLIEFAVKSKMKILSTHYDHYVCMSAHFNFWDKMSNKVLKFRWNVDFLRQFVWR